MIPFNKAPYVGNEITYIQQAIGNNKICGDGEFTKHCHKILEETFGIPKVLLTTSCTHALEMAAILIDIKPGDEVIMPSFTFVSTANAFVRLGAKIVFVDIRPDTMNIDEKLIENAITDKTKAIVVVHYAGVSCEMDTINAIAKQHGLKVIEDAAQGVNAYYKGKPLGTLADMGCYSFHETKNYSMGEGGALALMHVEDIQRAEIIREKGTNRSQFFRGEIDKYTWVDCGSSYLPSDINAAYLYAQLEDMSIINNKRLNLWHLYHEGFERLEEKGYIERPCIPDHCKHNGHIYAIKAKNLEERTKLISYLKAEGIGAVFHYVPLHKAEGGKKWGRFCGEDRFTTIESERLLRLPMFYELKESEVIQIIHSIETFYEK